MPRPRPNPVDYGARINRVTDHIDAHLSEPLNLTRLARIAHVSPWHFHRVFQALTGETLAERVRRRRVEVAASNLLKRPPLTALHIALDVGFSSSEVFTRAFSAHFGMTPTAWRRGGCLPWADKNGVLLRKIHQADRKTNQEVALAFAEDAELWPRGHHPRKGKKTMNITIQTLPETRLAYMRHTGPFGSSAITKMWMRFVAWAGSAGLLKPRPRMYGVSQDNPQLTAPEKCRYDACIPVDDAFKPSGEIGVQTLWGGRYACTTFTGTPADVHETWMSFVRELVKRYQPADHPAIEIYEPDFTVDPKTGAFSCVLAVPVRAG